MKEEFGNIWEMEADARCISTNGEVNQKGEAIMGKGVALQAKVHCPGIETEIGKHLQETGNHVYLIASFSANLMRYKMLYYYYFTFPTKNKWKESSSLPLIENSCLELISIINRVKFKRVLLPRPGCGNGGLKWENVKPAIQDLLDDRVVIVELPK